MFCIVVVVCSMVENAPTCYRAPRWPDPEFPRKIPKKYLPARNSGTQEIPQKYQKYAFLVFGGVFCSVFSGYFRGKFWESRISGRRGRRVFFRFFSWRFRVGPFRGPVAGQGVLKSMARHFGLLARKVQICNLPVLD